MFSLQRLFALLRPVREDVVEQLAAEIMRRCRVSVRTRVCQKVVRMSRNTARGYIRAHAVQCVAAELNAATTRLSMGAALPPKVAAAAIAQLIAAELDDMAITDVAPPLRAAAA